MDYPHPSLPRRLSRSLPLLTDLREEHSARLALLGEQLVAPVSVVPDRRCRDHHGWRLLQPCNPLGQQMRPLLPALQDAPLLLHSPASFRDALSRQMYYGAEPRQISFDLARLRVPANVSFGTRRASQTVDPVPSRLQLRDQSRPDKPPRPAHENVHTLPSNADDSSIYMVTTATLQNRIGSPTFRQALQAERVSKVATSPDISSKPHPLDERALTCATICVDGIRMSSKCITDGAPA